jgi:hypothetical protein
MIFLGVRRIAVGQIDARDPHRAVRRRDHRLDEARVIVFVVAGQPLLTSSNGNFDSSATPLKVFWPWIATL